MKLSQSLPKNIINKAEKKSYLLHKISDALQIKYSNAFSEANYNPDELNKDIETLITTKYCNWPPRQVFNPIEKEIINKVKTKAPNVEMKVKKARFIKREIPLYDKYEEADMELLRFKKEAEEQNNKNKEEKKTSTKNNLLKSTKLKNKNKSSSIIIKPFYQNIKPSIQNEKFVRHDLIDKYKIKLEYDPQIKYNTEANNRYAEEVKSLKEKNSKIRDDINLYLSQQISEKQKRLQLEQDEKNKYNEYLKNEYLKMKEIERQKILKREKEIETINKLIKESEQEKLNKILLEKKQKEKDYEQLLKSIENEKSLEENLHNERVKKFQKEAKIYNEENQNFKKFLIQKDKADELKAIEESKILNDKQDNNNLSIKQKVKNLQDSQQIVYNYLQKLYESKKKSDENKFIKEREEQELKKIKEYELQEQERIKKIEDLKKSMNLDILYKKNKKQKNKKLKKKKKNKNIKD